MNETQVPDPLDEWIRRAQDLPKDRSAVDPDELLEYIRGQMDEASRESFLERLARNPRVQREVQEIVRELEALESPESDRSLEGVDPALVDRLVRQIHENTPHPGPSGSSSWRWRWLWTPTAGYTSALLILLIFLWIPRGESPQRFDPPSAAQSYQLRALASDAIQRGSSTGEHPSLQLDKERELFCLTVWLPDGVRVRDPAAELELSLDGNALLQRPLSELTTMVDGYESVMLCLESASLLPGLLTVEAKGTPDGAPLFRAWLELTE